MTDIPKTMEIPKGFLNGIRIMCSHSGSMQQLNPLLPQMNELSELNDAVDLVVSSLSIPREHVQNIFRVANTIHYIQSSFGSATAEDIIGLFSRSIEEIGDSELIEGWQATATHLPDLIRPDSPIIALKKHSENRIAYERVATEFRIYSDFRPTFDSEGKEILNCNISHQLTVNFKDAQGDDDSFFIHLDSEDLSSLITQCERAIKKESVLLDLFYPESSGEES